VYYVSGTIGWTNPWYTYPTATFAIDTYTLTYTAGANGTITGTSPQTVNYGANGAAVTAVPNTGYHFVQWSDTSTANPRTDTNVMANVNVTATFAINTYTLTVNMTGSGTVAKFPDQATYDYGTLVTLTATPATGYPFTGWSGDLTGTTNPTNVTMTGTKTVTAIFTSSTTTSGDIDGNGSVTMGDALLLAQSIVGIATLTTAQRQAADVNQDGSITMADTLQVAQIVVGIAH